MRDSGKELCPAVTSRRARYGGPSANGESPGGPGLSRQRAGKPDSVWRDHPSRRSSMAPKGPRSPRSCGPPGPRRAGSSVLLGLAPGGVCPAAASPRRRCALTAPFHLCLCAVRRHRPCVSVALSRGFPRVGVTHRPCPVVSGLSSRDTSPAIARPAQPMIGAKDPKRLARRPATNARAAWVCRRFRLRPAYPRRRTGTHAGRSRLTQAMSRSSRSRTGRVEAPSRPGSRTTHLPSPG